MSFFSRLSNLISGFSHTLINNIEQDNPGIREEMRKQEIHKQNKDLQEAMTHLKLLEMKLEKQLATAPEEKHAEIQAEIDKHKAERKEIAQLLTANNNRRATEAFADIQSQISQESEADEAIGRLKAHTEVVEHLITKPTPTRKSSVTKESTSPPSDTEDAPSQETPKPKRSL